MLVVIEKLLDAPQLQSFRAALEKADWQDGRASAGSLSASVKQNQQPADSCPVALELANRILSLLGHHPQFIAAALPLRIFPPRFNRYAGGGHYGAHVDSAVMYPPHNREPVRSDISATLFLTEPGSYDGGELCVETPFGVQEVKLAAGDMVLYPSSSLHQVTPVTRGARTSAFFWVQSMVRSDAQRGLLYDLDLSIQSLTARVSADDPDLLRLTTVYHNLLRQWADA
ncbi:MAG TPA: Fe2+-dependent dioxygenase [Spongiibacteraceae bacterium]|jgi:PKHD-type hydroxylase|nr:Fe2+-dependent dioxygenase [Spongiibacteraceae bacterium]HUH38909.1 Fe2+-dependent dioxygenase [Spongiibacteraceae bacterium]